MSHSKTQTQMEVIDEGLEILEPVKPEDQSTQKPNCCVHAWRNLIDCCRYWLYADRCRGCCSQEPDDEVYFENGGDNISLSRYRGESVVIREESRGHSNGGLTIDDNEKKQRDSKKSYNPGGEDHHDYIKESYHPILDDSEMINLDYSTMALQSDENKDQDHKYRDEDHTQRDQGKDHHGHNYSTTHNDHGGGDDHSGGDRRGGSAHFWGDHVGGVNLSGNDHGGGVNHSGGDHGGGSAHSGGDHGGDGNHSGGDHGCDYSGSGDCGSGGGDCSSGAD